jgi:hypothetical protein
MLGRVRRTAGRTAVSVRSVAALAKIHWHEAGPLDRVQIAAAGALALLVFGLFAIGAATRSRDSGDQGLASASFSAKAGRASSRPAVKRTPGSAEPSVGRSLAAHALPGASLPAGGMLGLRHAHTPSAKRTPAKHHKRAAPAPAAANGLSSQSTPIVVGVSYRAASAGASLVAGLGVGEVPGDVARQAGAVAWWINRHGGIGGRTLAPRPVSFDPALSTSYWSAFSAACTTLATGGLRPLAVVGAIEDALTQVGCLSSRAIPFVGDGPVVGDAKLFADAGPYLFTPGSMALDRLTAAEVRVLLADGFLGRSSVVGLLRLDGQVFARTADRVRSALAAAHVSVANEQVLPAASTLADASTFAARVAAAVFAMHGAGVDRLIVLDEGIATATFMREAERQGFRPRYALNSAMGPAWLASVAAPAQLEGAQGVGFAPLLDVGPAGEPSPNDSRKRCESIYRDAKVAIGARTPAGQFAALSLCDDLLAVRDAVVAADGTDTAAWTRALERIGRKRVSAVALAAKLGAGRHDGAAVVRRVRFDDGCSCMRYAGDPEPAT